MNQSSPDDSPPLLKPIPTKFNFSAPFYSIIEKTKEYFWWNVTDLVVNSSDQLAAIQRLYLGCKQVTKSYSNFIDFLIAVYYDTKQYRLTTQYVTQNKNTIPSGHLYFEVIEPGMFDERNIFDTIDESIKGLVYHIKSEVDANENDNVLLQDINYIREYCRYDSTIQKLSVTKADLMMQDIRDRAYRIYSKYPRIEDIRWSVDLKESIANDILSLISPGKFVKFDKQSYTQIDKMLEKNKAVLITGIGGVGKSTMAWLYSQYKVSKELNNFCVKSFNMHNSDDIIQEYFEKWIDLLFTNGEYKKS